jgi:ketosteroid isomerase-like protein
MKTIVALLLALALAGLTFIPVNKRDREEEIVLQLFDAFNRHQWIEMAGFYAERAEFLDPAFGDRYLTRSHEQIKKHYEELHQLFPDIQDSVLSVISSGDKVVVEFISSGVSPDGSRWKLPVCTVFTISGDKIIRDASYYGLLNN